MCLANPSQPVYIYDILFKYIYIYNIYIYAAIFQIFKQPYSSDNSSGL